MIKFKKAKKKNLPMLIEYKLLTITPYIKDPKEKLKVIAFTNDFLKSHYEEFRIIYYYLKPIGIYFINDKELDTLYIKEKYQKRGIGTKALKKIKDKIETIKVRKENDQAIKFYKKNGFSKEETKKEVLILRKGD